MSLPLLGLLLIAAGLVVAYVAGLLLLATRVTTERRLADRLAELKAEHAERILQARIRRAMGITLALRGSGEVYASPRYRPFEGDRGA